MKKGISIIVANVLLALIVIAFVSVLWLFVYPMFNKPVELSSFETQLFIVTDEGYTFYDDTAGEEKVTVQIKVSGKKAPNYIQIIITLEDGEELISVHDSPELNQVIRYTLNVNSTYTKGEKPVSVSVAPIFNIEGQNILGKRIVDVRLPVRRPENSLLFYKDVIPLDPRKDYSSSGDNEKYTSGGISGVMSCSGPGDCPNDNINLVCEGNSVYRKGVIYDCVNSKCQSTSINEMIEECIGGLVCVDGSCVSQQGITSCPYTLSEPNTVYVLQNDISSTETCLNISAENVTLDGKGFRVTYGAGGVKGYGVSAKGYDNLVIKNTNFVEGSLEGINKHAIALVYSNSSEVFNNDFTLAGSSSGIFLGSSEDLDIYSNNFFMSGNYSVGIIALYLEDSDIFSNKVHTINESGPGMVFHFSSDLRLSFNEILTEGKSSWGILLSSSPKSSLTLNTIETGGLEGYGIIVSSSADSLVSYNVINTTGEAGLGLNCLSDYVNFSSNFISTTGEGADGIRLEGLGCIIENNKISVLNSDIIEISPGESDNKFINNEITGRSSSFYDLVLGQNSYNNWFIDQYLESYSFEEEGARLGILDSSYGELIFSEDVRGSGSSLSEDISFGANYLYVNPMSSVLNKSAEVILYDTGFSLANQVLKNGLNCAECSGPVYLGGTDYSFTIPGVGEYKVNFSGGRAPTQP